MEEKVIEFTTNGATAEMNGAEAPQEALAPASDAEVIAQLQSELAAAQAKAEEYKDKLQRTAADFQNSRRRQEKQLEDALERASERLLKRLLPIADDLTLAFQNLPGEMTESQQAWLGGFQQIQKKVNTLLEDEGVTLIPPDGAFDPTRHEAVMSEPHETIPSGHIVATLRSGYEHKGRVLRPALVRVAL
jgi:molecular chaperone GrpE